MIQKKLAICLLLLTSVVAVANDGPEKKFSHVLLISVDGLHALDVGRAEVSLFENNGNLPITVNALSVTGTSYSIVTLPSLPVRLEAGDQVNFTVTFAPMPSRLDLAPTVLTRSRSF